MSLPERIPPRQKGHSGQHVAAARLPVSLVLSIITIAEMASIAIMIGGAVLNATTFVGGSYLAKYMSGSNVDAEKKRHDLALEKYERDYQVWQKSRQRVLDWYSQRRDQQDIAAHDMGNTDEALKLYNRVHDAVNQPQISLGKEPEFGDYYKPSSSQKLERLYT